MRGFKTPASAQRFISSRGVMLNLFKGERYKHKANDYRKKFKNALNIFNESVSSYHYYTSIKGHILICISTPNKLTTQNMMILFRFMIVPLLFVYNATASLATEIDKSEKLLLISKFSLEYTPFHEALTEISSENMVLFTSYKMSLEEANKFKENYKEIQRFHPNDFSSTKFELACIKLRERFPYTRIIVFEEADSVFAAHLRRLFNLKGQSVESALAFKNKYTMKTYVSRAGFEVANFSQITSLSELT